MAKNIRRMLAMVLVMCMFVSALPMQALAAESDKVTETIDGVTTETTTSTSTSSDGNGNTTVTVSTQGTTSGTQTSTGATVSGNSSSVSSTTTATTTETTPDGKEVTVEKVVASSSNSQSTTTTTNTTNNSTTDANGNKVETSVTTSTTVSSDKSVTVEGEFGGTSTTTQTTTTTTTTGADGSTSKVEVTQGTESSERTEEVKPGQEVPEVKVEMKPGESNSNSGSITDTKTEGTEPNGSGTNYDYTETTTTTDRTVTGTVSNGTIIESSTTFESVVAPEKYDGKEYDTVSNNKHNPQEDGVKNDNPAYVKPGQEQKTDEEGYDLFLSGMGEVTDAASPVFKHIVYQKYTEQDKLDGKIPEGYDVGDAIPDPNNEGEYLIDEEKSKLITGANNKTQDGMDYQASQLVLTYKDGTYFYAYCADYLVETDQVPGHLYKLENLEDSGHYTEEDAQKLRSIVLNGYWGTEEGTGSLQNMKDMLTEYAKTNPTVTVKDKDGKDFTRNIADLIKDLDEDEALAVTQAAIWAYSINRKEALDGVDKVVVVGAQSGIKCYHSTNMNGYYSEYRAANNQLENLMAITSLTEAQLIEKGFTADVLAAREAEALLSDARMKALFDCLMNLNVEDYNKAEDITTVINEHTIENVSIVVTDKVSDATSTDEDGVEIETDVYNAELSFTLAIVPEKDTDDLLVYLCDTKGNVLKDQNNEPIIRRLSGENKEGESYETLSAENGVYTLTNLQLSENVDFELRLDGSQTLKEGAYLYTAEGGRLASQTLVGMAKGKQTVTAGVTISFDVDEKTTVVKERVWYNDPSKETTPPTPPEYPVDPVDFEEETPQVFRLANQNVEEIPEEPVPLAAPVITGDNSGMWIAVILLSVFAMAAINLFDKKRQQETF